MQLVSTPEEGVPNAGETSTGLFENTREPDPVSSDMTPASWAEVVAAKAERLFVYEPAAKAPETDPAGNESVVPSKVKVLAVVMAVEPGLINGTRFNALVRLGSNANPASISANSARIVALDPDELVAGAPETE